MHSSENHSSSTKSRSEENSTLNLKRFSAVFMVTSISFLNCVDLFSILFFDDVGFNLHKDIVGKKINWIRNQRTSTSVQFHYWIYFYALHLNHSGIVGSKGFVFSQLLTLGKFSLFNLITKRKVSKHFNILFNASFRTFKSFYFSDFSTFQPLFFFCPIVFRSSFH